MVKRPRLSGTPSYPRGGIGILCVTFVQFCVIRSFIIVYKTVLLMMWRTSLKR